jgi:hypothetical protein
MTVKTWWLATSKNEGHCSYEELKYRKILAQGWPKLGDLDTLYKTYIKYKIENKLIDNINNLRSYVYNNSPENRNAGNIITNLFKFKEGDLVVCTEGETVRGIARLGENPKYRFDDGNGLYEYAQTISPIAEWVDWNINIAGKPPSPSSMGPVGIEGLVKDRQLVIDAWEKLKA